MLAAHPTPTPPSPRPQVLSDVVESLIGAVYVDSGGSLAAVWDVASRLLHPLVTPETVAQHPIRRLQARGTLHRSVLFCVLWRVFQLAGGEWAASSDLSEAVAQRRRSTPHQSQTSAPPFEL